MANQRLVWDLASERKYTYGVSQGVLYTMGDTGEYETGVVWNGLVNVSDKPEGGDATKLYADGIYYADIPNVEQYKMSLEAYMYPDEFSKCDGTAEPEVGVRMGQQRRKKFGMSWRTEIGNANTDSLGYVIHVAYGLRAAPSERSYDTVNESAEAKTLSWDVDGTPVSVAGYKPSCKLEFDSTKLSAGKMKALENLLYGSEAAAAKLPTPDELFAAIKGASEL
nr:MAG TPA: tail tube protein [Caudoviricetes sp.]